MALQFNKNTWILKISYCVNFWKGTIKIAINEIYFQKEKRMQFYPIELNG